MTTATAITTQTETTAATKKPLTLLQAAELWLADLQKAEDLKQAEAAKASKQ